MYRFSLTRLAIIAVILAIPFAAFGDPAAKARGVGSTIDWRLSTTGHDRVELRIMTPSGDLVTREFKGGQSPSLRIQDLGSQIEDGTYQYELRIYKSVPADVAKRLATARDANDDAAARKIIREAGLTALGHSGAFTIQNGAIVNTEATEAGATPEVVESLVDGNPVAPRAGTGNQRPGKVAVNDQVIPDDLIVQGSICAGFDCVNNESFGFDTIRMKENNLRIKAEDTSTGTFPTNDWQLTFNDSASGGASKFSVEDITGAKVPMTITGGAATNSIFVDSTGRVGFRTSTPVLDLHVSTSNTPAIRLEQTNAGGFTAQTWDIAGNEANFFVRDVTSGSRLPFRIRPGAPTSSVDISADGDVGIGTASPNKKLHIHDSTDNQAFVLTGTATGTTATDGILFSAVGTLDAQLWNFENGFTRFGTNNTERMRITAAGNVGIGCDAPASDLVIASGTGCTTPSSSINAGSAQFTVASSRTFKENITPVQVPNILDRIAKVDVFQYDFKEGPKDRLGLIAEDFHQVFQRGDEKYIDGSEVQLALWMAVQQLTEQNKVLTNRLSTLEKELKDK